MPNGKLIISSNTILVSDEDAIKVNDYYVKENQVIKCVEEEVGLANMCYPKAITGIPELPQLDLSLVADEIGYVDVEKLAKAEHQFNHKTVNEIAFRLGFEEGFNANPKKYTGEDMIEFAKFYSGYKKMISDEQWQLIEAAPKEVLDFWLKERRPKVYNVEYTQEANTIKVVKILNHA